MTRKVSEFELKEQPIYWGRTFLCGAISAIFMMCFIDIFYLMGITPFSWEAYIGSAIRGSVAGGPHNWTIGFIANSIIGGLFGIFYASCFERVFFRANGRLGARLAFFHTLIAGCLFLPFLNALHDQMNVHLYPSFGFLGFGLSAPTGILIITGHFLFGVSIGTFYGPVRAERVQSKYFEFGQTGLTSEQGGITSEEDPEDTIAV